MIQESMKSKKFYRMLGSRFHLSDAESCATAAFMCLQAGGLNELLGQNDQRTSKFGPLTPSMLVKYVKKAQNEEQARYPEASEISKKFIESETRKDEISSIEATIITTQKELEKQAIHVVYGRR